MRHGVSGTGHSHTCYLPGFDPESVKDFCLDEGVDDYIAAVTGTA